MAKVSIALVGESFYLCGPYGNNISSAATADFAEIFDHSHNPNVHHTYAALGECGAYYLRFFDEKSKEKRSTWSLNDYPGLSSYLRDNASGDPYCVSLGESGNYFISDEWGRAWNLPSDVKDHIDIESKSKTVERMWFGKDGSYVAQKSDGSLAWDLKGHYGSLKRTLKYDTASIRCMGLNLLDSSSYFVLFKDSTFQFNPGRTGFSLSTFAKWAQRLQ